MDKRINSKFTFKKVESMLPEEGNGKDQMKTSRATFNIETKSTLVFNKTNGNKKSNNTMNNKSRNQNTKLDNRKKRESIYNTSGSNKNQKPNETQHDTRKKNTTKQKQNQRKPENTRFIAPEHKSKVKSEARMVLIEEEKYEKDKRKTEITNKLQRFKSEKKIKMSEESGDVDVDDGSDILDKLEVQVGARTSSGEQIPETDSHDSPESKYWVNVLKMADEELQRSSDWMDMLKKMSSNEMEEEMKNTLNELKIGDESVTRNDSVTDEQPDDDELKVMKSTSASRCSLLEPSIHQLSAQSSIDNESIKQTECSVKDEYEDQIQVSFDSDDNQEDSYSESSLPDSISECLVDDDQLKCTCFEFSNKIDDHTINKRNFGTELAEDETETTNLKAENKESDDDMENELINDIQVQMKDDQITADVENPRDLSKNIEEELEQFAYLLGIKKEISDRLDLCSECSGNESSDQDDPSCFLQSNGKDKNYGMTLSDSNESAEFLKKFEESLTKISDFQLQFEFPEEGDDIGENYDKQDEITDHEACARYLEKHETNVINDDQSVEVIAANEFDMIVNVVNCTEIVTKFNQFVEVTTESEPKIDVVNSYETVDKLDDEDLQYVEHNDYASGDRNEPNDIDSNDAMIEDKDNDNEGKMDQIDVTNIIEKCDINQAKFHDSRESVSYLSQEDEALAEELPIVESKHDQTGKDNFLEDMSDENSTVRNGCTDEENGTRREIHEDFERQSSHECHLEKNKSKESVNSNQTDEECVLNEKEEINRTEDNLDVSIATESINDEFVSMLINECEIPLIENSVVQENESEFHETNQSKSLEVNDNTESDTDVLTPLPGDYCYASLQHELVILENNTEDVPRLFGIRARPMLSITIVSIVVMATAYILSLLSRARKE